MDLCLILQVKPYIIATRRLEGKAKNSYLCRSEKKPGMAMFIAYRPVSGIFSRLSGGVLKSL